VGFHVTADLCALAVAIWLTGLPPYLPRLQRRGLIEASASGAGAQVTSGHAGSRFRAVMRLCSSGLCCAGGGRVALNRNFAIFVMHTRVRKTGEAHTSGRRRQTGRSWTINPESISAANSQYFTASAALPPNRRLCCGSRRPATIGPGIRHRRRASLDRPEGRFHYPIVAIDALARDPLPPSGYAGNGPSVE
jgi:hypothetical protein